MSRAGFGLSILGRRVVLTCGPEITEEKELDEGSPIGGPVVNRARRIRVL